MTAVFYSVISDTAYHAKGYTPTIDMGTLSFQDTNQVDITGGKINGAVIGEDDPRAAKFSEVDVSGAITADVFVGSAAGLTGIVAADSIGVIAGENPFTMEGITADDYETSFYIEDPTEDRVVTIPNVSGTMITTGNFPIDLTIHGGRIDSTNIGDSIPALGRFSELTTLEGININDGNTVLSNIELGVLDGVTQGQVQALSLIHI